MFLLPPPQSLSNFKQPKHFNVFLYSFIHNRKPLANVLLHQYSCFLYFGLPLIMFCSSFFLISNSGLTTKNLTPEQRQQIIAECVEDMISPTDLARKWNCNADTIRTWVRKAGLTLPKQYKKSIYPDSGGAQANRGMGYDMTTNTITSFLLPFFLFLHPLLGQQCIPGVFIRMLIT